MNCMNCGAFLTDMESDFEKVKKTLYKEVYGQEI